jgi:hypothetical protein
MTGYGPPGHPSRGPTSRAESLPCDSPGCSPNPFGQGLGERAENEFPRPVRPGINSTTLARHVGPSGLQRVLLTSLPGASPNAFGAHPGLSYAGPTVLAHFVPPPRQRKNSAAAGRRARERKRVPLPPSAVAALAHLALISKNLIAAKMRKSHKKSSSDLRLLRLFAANLTRLHTPPICRQRYTSATPRHWHPVWKRDLIAGFAACASAVQNSLSGYSRRIIRVCGLDGNFEFP